MLIAVDTGASKTLIARLTNDGKITAQVRFPTPKDVSDYLSEMQLAIRELAGSKEPQAIIVALPGVVKENVALACPNLKWHNTDVRPALKKLFPKTPVFVENDANLAGLGETRLLHPQPHFSLYVTVSTGIGTGFTTNGKIDPSLRLSEGGTMLVEYDGVPRQWETFAAGSAIYKAYGKYARDIKSKRTWYGIADRISRGFLAVIPLVQPEVIIIGGSMGTHFDKYKDQLQVILQEKLPPHIPCPPIIQAKHPEQAVIYGCYYHGLACLADKKT